MTAHRPNPLDPCEAHEYSDATRSAVQNRIADDAFKPTGYVYGPEVIACLKVLLKAGVTQSYSGLGSLLNLVETTRTKLLEIADEIGFEHEAKKGKIDRKSPERSKGDQ